MQGKLTRVLMLSSLVVLLVVFLGYSLYDFNEQIRKDTTQQAQDYLMEASIHSREIMRTKMDEYEANTKAVAFLVASQSSLEEILSVMQMASRELGIRRLSYTLPDGTSFSSDGYTVNLSSRKYIKEALGGASAISDVIISMFDGSEVFVIASPVWRNGEVVAVLHSTYFTESLHELIAMPGYGKDRLSYLVRSDGYLITQPLPEYDERLANHTNVFEFMNEKEFDTNRIIAIQRDLRQKKDGFVRFGGAHDSYYMSYLSMGFKDWFVFHMIPTTIIDIQANRIIEDSVILIVQIGLTLVALLGLLFYYAWKARLAAEQNKNELEFINSNMQGGLYKCGIVGSGYFDYVSDGFLRMVGYTREELDTELHNVFMSVVYEEDKVRLKQLRKDAFDNSHQGELTSEYRIQRKDGSVIWVLDKGQFLIDDNGIPWFYSIVLDHQAQKEMVDELHYNELRYRIIAEQSSAVIFDYDYKTQMIDIAHTFYAQYGFTPKAEQFPQSAFASGLFHGDDVSVIQDLFTPPLPSEPAKKAEARIQKRGVGYIWVRFTITTIFDENGYASKGIGRLIDIDSQKRDIDELMKRATMDDLTGLYNRATTQQLIETILEGSTKETHALLIIDIDDFKLVNDTRGHLVGDHVLADFAQILKGISRASDIVGRMGGDEFVVFLRDILNKDVAMQKARDICKHLELYQVFRSDMGSQISCSIGMAVAPKDATKFDDLFMKADMALYQVKNTGKNRYFAYAPEIANKQYVSGLYTLEGEAEETVHVELLKQQ